jgi:hypothetical protein
LFAPSGVLLIGTGLLFNAGALSATTLTACWVVVFFFASAVTGPALFGKLVETGKEINVFWGYLLGATLTIGAGVAEWFIGVEGAGRSLEDVARPLTAEEEGAEASA